MQPEYVQHEWDTIPQEGRERLILMQSIEEVLFAKTHIPFYQLHYSHLSEKNIMELSSLEEFSVVIPETNREHLSNNHFSFFLPDVEREKDPNKGRMRNKGTGGTTNVPNTIIYSPEDWRAQAELIVREIRFDYRQHIEDLKNLLVFGLYHGDHITNELYQSAFSMLGVEFFDRASTRPHDILSNIDFFQNIRPTALLGPPEDVSGKLTKGITLSNFLRRNIRDRRRDKYRLSSASNAVFQALFWSSTPLTKDFHYYLSNYLEIPYQQGIYGFTEIGILGVTCQQYPRDFHLVYGPNVLMVKHPSGRRLIRDGEYGYVVASRIGAVTKDQKIISSRSTTLINYRSGDYATLLLKDKPCDCGRTTPVLFDLQRKEDVQAKLKFGCQAD